ncbi:DUF6527 family protein [Fredinandcohnia sp. QZ13]|uniref:DUF6527 family protein n=1 Tax=Fredinandcohnia sp. QZ13 TaxID=3073144 RepID=UPI00285373EF|nr:DUF6527 family protein [Fredinandcohnia sp. QZ13]MDR4888366.1 DUF6527 family protein [Fredinandcohnia sp. QZ13]
MKIKVLKHSFVSLIPDNIEENKIYISLDYNTAIHKCACGCGEEVVTPLSPSDWKLIYNGESVSLSPSVGNWSYMCRSHYWIRDNRIVWAENWSDEKINKARKDNEEQAIKEKKGFFNLLRRIFS